MCGGLNKGICRHNAKIAQCARTILLALQIPGEYDVDAFKEDRATQECDPSALT